MSGNHHDDEAHHDDSVILASQSSDDVSEARSESSETGELGLPLPKNHAPLPRFANMVIFFNKLKSIHGEGSKTARRRLIAGFIQSWKTHVGNDIYPAVRLLFPQEDEQLRQLSKLREQQLGKTLVEALNIPPKSTDALALLASRKGGMTHGVKGDEDSLASRAKSAVAKRYSNADYGSLRIDEVTNMLEEFANSTKERRVDIMSQMVNAMNPEEIYWVIKILLRSVAVNCSERLFLSIFHENAVQVYMVNKSLETVCHQLWSSDFSVSESDKSVHLMSYYCPMKAKFVKGAAENMNVVVDLFKKQKESEQEISSNAGQFYMEEKIDGERVQLHWKREGNVTKFYSRRGTDYTSSYRGIFRNGKRAENEKGEDETEDESSESMSELGATDGVSLEDIVSDDTMECILDGEVVAWDPETNDICGQSKVRELTAHNKGGSYRHMIFVFDVVFHNGKVLTEVPLKERKARLESIFAVEKRQAGAGRIQLLPYKLGSTPEDVSREFRRVISQMSEGLVLKNLQSHYELDGKSNSWVKVKPEFVDGYQGENMDLVIVGCYRGSGRLSQQFSSYLLALKDEKVPNRYVAFTGVGSGICLAMYNHINGLLRDHIFALPKPPSWLELGGNKKPDYYIKPEDSVVLEIKYSEIATVNAEKGNGKLDYGVGYSLRFPRYVKTREDKDLNSSLTVGEMLETLEVSTKRSQKSHDEYLRKERAMQNPRISLAKRIKLNIDEKPVHIVRDIFHGQPFYVCGDIESPKYMTKSDLENTIREYGGSISPIYIPPAIPIGDRNLPKVAQLSSDGIPVMNPNYLFDCILNGKMFIPESVHFYSNAVVSVTSDMAPVDKYGFSLQRKQSMSDIEKLFDAISTDNIVLTESQKQEAMNYLLDPLSPQADELHVATFSGIEAYLAPDLPYRFLAQEMILYGSGTIASNPEDCNRIISATATAETRTGTTTTTTNVQWVFDRWNSHAPKQELLD